MKKILSSILITAFTAFLSACSCGSSTSIFSELNPEETFTSSDEPVSLTYDSRSFESPWGYYKSENASRYYPILVSGYWGEGALKYAAVEKDYPAFVIDFQYSTETYGQALAQWIKNAVSSGYRIDTNRIYLTGFSAGGSGSFPLAKGMYAEGMYFAAIIRVAGQSQADIGNTIASKTAIWYHIGLSDDDIRITIAQQTLAYNRAYACNSTAEESSITDTIAYSTVKYPRTTITLTRNGYQMFKYSEYTGMGHDSSPCYTDDALFYWMFSNSLIYR